MKNYKESILFLVFFLNVLSVKSQDFVKVDLQRGFRNDTVSFFINDVEIFENQVATSSRLTGNAGFGILFTKSSKSCYYVTQFYPFEQRMPSGTPLYDRANFLTGPETICIEEDEDSVMWRFKVVLGACVVEKTIDISRHKYIGIDRFDEKLEKGLFIVKSKIPFYYD
ncbi:MAG: hypothetical protein ACJAWV_001608 [Flammeovirgaceae bacterium]|jgi:hypothetical protein